MKLFVQFVFAVSLILCVEWAGAAPTPWQSAFDGPAMTFSQIKYYTIYSKELSAVILYAKFSPGFFDKYFVLASVTHQGRNHTMYKSFPAGEVRETVSSTLRLGVQAGIIENSDGSVEYYNHQGSLQWDLKVSGGIQSPAPRQFMFFPSSLTETLAGLKWNVFWQPEILDGLTTGEIRIRGQSFAIQAEGSYHDDTHGNWNFLSEPYFWLYLSGTNWISETKERYHVLMADMYKSPERKFGLQVYDEQGALRVSYPPGSYTIRIQEYVKAPIFRFEIGSDDESSLSYPALRTTNTENHQVPLLMVIETNDKRLRMEFKTRALFPYYPVIDFMGFPIGNIRYGNMYVDDYVIDGKVDLILKTGKRVQFESVGGLQYLRKGSDSHSVLIDFNKASSR